MSNIVSINNTIKVGSDQKLLLIAGPCQIESLEHCLKIAQFLVGLTTRYPIQLVFKSSFDKANRTSVKGQRGIGIDEGLKILQMVRSETSLPVLTDVHSAEQVPIVAEVVDVLQTPAFLCRQTDLLVAVGRTGKPVNVKKGQFLAPEDMRFVAEKIANTGNEKILLCERGSTFGYRDLVVDMRSLQIMREIGFPVIFDATHSVQSPGGLQGSSGGRRDFIAPLTRAAAAVGIDGLFLECHDNPDSAPSDAQSMLDLKQVEPVVSAVCRIRESLIV